MSDPTNNMTDLVSADDGTKRKFMAHVRDKHPILAALMSKFSVNVNGERVALGAVIVSDKVAKNIGAGKIL